MRLDDILEWLFPAERTARIGAFGVVDGWAVTAAGTRVGLTGIAGGEPVGVDAALGMADRVLAHLDVGGPLVVLVDTQSQAMTRRDELLGLNECLAHLAKSLLLASMEGCRTIGMLHRAAAAGAFIATALATDTLIAVPGAAPSVMDLPSVARVTKLPIETVEAMAQRTPIFAPGLEPFSMTGAISDVWQDPATFAGRLDEILARDPLPDVRDRTGIVRGGRKRAAFVSDWVMDAASGASACVTT